MDTYRQQGQLLIVGVIVVCLLISVCSIALTSFVTGTPPGATQIVRFVLTLLLCIALYQGKNWARWVMAVLMAVGAAGGLLSGVALISRTPGAFLLMLIGMLYLGCLATLFFAPSVCAFFASSNG